MALPVRPGELFQDPGAGGSKKNDIRDGIDRRATKAMSFQFFHQRKTSIRECREEAVGPLAEAYAIKAIEEERTAGYGLAVDPERIEIVGEGHL